MSISKTVQEIVDEQPVLSWALDSGIANYSATAEYLRPSVERREGRKVSLESILMSLRRLNLQKEKNAGEDLRAVVRNSKYSVESGFVDIVLDYKSSDIVAITKWSEELMEGSITSLIVGQKFASVITDSRTLLSKITSSNMSIVSVMENLAIFRIRMPKESMGVSGVIALFSQEFAKKGVSIIEMESAYSELAYIVREKDLAKAMDAFHYLKSKAGQIKG